MHVVLVQKHQLWQGGFHVAPAAFAGEVFWEGEVGLKQGQGLVVPVVHVGHGPAQIQRFGHPAGTQLIQGVQPLGQNPPHVGIQARGLEGQLGRRHEHLGVFRMNVQRRFQPTEAVAERGFSFGVRGLFEELLGLGRPWLVHLALGEPERCSSPNKHCTKAETEAEHGLRVRGEFAFGLGHKG